MTSLILHYFVKFNRFSMTGARVEMVVYNLDQPFALITFPYTSRPHSPHHVGFLNLILAII